MTRRPSRQIEPRECILIVCEGRKTEPKYLHALRKALRLTSASVEVVPQGAAPITVVDKAVGLKSERRREHKRHGIPDYAQVWCVIDVERPADNASLKQALQRAKDTKINVALSNPAFEFWLLLHFERIGHAFTDCAEVTARLKTHLPDYAKGGDVHSGLIDNRSRAVANARAIDRDQWHSQDDRLRCNPSTNVYELVELLDKMALRSPYRSAGP